MLRTESTYEIHYIQSPDNSQSFNRYSYCQNNPLRYTDPTGWQLVGGTRPRPQGFYDKWGDYYSRPAYEPRDFGIVQLSDANPDIAWMEANDLRRGGRNETKGGGSPVYDEHGCFLGTDDGGLQGVAIVMRREDFRQEMKHDDALALAVDLDDNNQDAEIRFYMHYSQLCNRPDWDGYLTLSEANEWYRDGSGEPLFADLSQIDLSSIASYGERQVGKRKRKARKDIPPFVLDYACNDDYIIVEQIPKFPLEQIYYDSNEITYPFGSNNVYYWIIDLETSDVYGPLTFEKYLEKKKDFGVPSTLRLKCEQ